MSAFTATRLPNGTSHEAAASLVEVIAGALMPGWVEEISIALDKCELQPTSRATYLAASAAVAVLLAHEIGQEAAPSEQEE
jgi:hypothetical protein